jgi:succinoglycan biosynthesis protein ExoW
MQLMMNTGLCCAPFPRFGVVIPHFQRQTGLLHRALSSICAQEYRPVQVVVVDDGSPSAASEEITAKLRDAVPGLTVTRQTNQGAAVARNTALDAMGEDVSAIAFLDSDDYWEPAHLRNAALALSRGADFFFANLRIEGTATDWFRKQAPHELLDNPRPVPEAPGVMQWAGSVAGLLAGKCMVMTSGVVFRRALMPQVRFPRKLRGAGGEDLMVWWALLARSSTIMYCPEPTVTYGTGGVGFWQHSPFGSVRGFMRVANEVRWTRHVLKGYPLNPAERQFLKERLAEHRETALVHALHLMRRRQENPLKEIMYLLKDDPVCAGSWCMALPKLLYTQLRRASASSRPDS